MKNKQRMVLPGIVMLILVTIYIFYFSPVKGLGSFKDYDPYSHAQKEIVVKLLAEKGIQQLEDGQQYVFYVEDKHGTQMPIKSAISLPEGFENSETITLTGHICGGSYELVNVEVD